MVDRPDSMSAQGSLVGTVAGASFFGLLGMGAGAGIVSLLSSDRVCGDSRCGFEEGIIAGVLGFGLGAGIGAQFGNGRRGSLTSDLLGGAVGSGLFVLIVASGDPDTAGILPLAALCTIAVPVIVERTSAGTRYRGRQMSLGFAPTPGGLTVALRTTF